MRKDESIKVSIFQIMDVCGRNYPPDRLTLKLIDALRPAQFENVQN